MEIRTRILLLFSFITLVSFPKAQENTFNQNQVENYSVANSIHAEILKKDENSIRIFWDAPKETGEIIVARASSMIDTPEKCMIADSLGKYPSGIAGGVTQIFDYNLKPGTYYYAVVLAHRVKKNMIKLIPGKNFTTIPVVIEHALAPGGANADNKIPEIPDDARVIDLTVKKEGKYLRLNWTPYEKAIPNATVYTVYRSSEPMSSLSLMRKAEKLTELSHPESTFLDQDLNKSRTIYYGVSVRSGAKEILPLINGQSFTRFFYIGNPSKDGSENIPSSEYSEDEMHVKDIKATVEGLDVKLEWKAPEKADANTVYTIYQALKPLSGGTATFLGGSVRKLGEINHPDTIAQVRMKSLDSKIYFGVTVKHQDKEGFNLVENESFVAINSDKVQNPEEDEQSKVKDNQEEDSVDKQQEEGSIEKEPEENAKDKQEEEEFSGTDDELDKILKRTYWKKEYSDAIHYLKSYARDGNSVYLKGKAKFFTGLSYYKKGNYQEALKYFINKDSKFYNTERSEFWSKRCLSRISGGNP